MFAASYGTLAGVLTSDCESAMRRSPDILVVLERALAKVPVGAYAAPPLPRHVLVEAADEIRELRQKVANLSKEIVKPEK